MAQQSNDDLGLLVGFTIVAVLLLVIALIIEYWPVIFGGGLLALLLWALPTGGNGADTEAPEQEDDDAVTLGHRGDACYRCGSTSGRTNWRFYVCHPCQALVKRNGGSCAAEVKELHRRAAALQRQVDASAFYRAYVAANCNIGRYAREYADSLLARAADIEQQLAEMLPNPLFAMFVRTHAPNLYQIVTFEVSALALARQRQGHKPKKEKESTREYYHRRAVNTKEALEAMFAAQHLVDQCVDAEIRNVEQNGFSAEEQDTRKAIIRAAGEKAMQKLLGEDDDDHAGQAGQAAL